MLALDDKRRCEAHDGAVGVLASARLRAISASQHAARARRTRGSISTPIEEALAAHVGDRRMVAVARSSPSRYVALRARARVAELLASEQIECRVADRRGERVAAERAAVVAGREHAPSRRRGRRNALTGNSPPPSALPSDQAVGAHRPRGRRRAARPVRPRPVCTSSADHQHVVARADLAHRARGSRPAARRCRPRPGPARRGTPRCAA